MFKAKPGLGNEVANRIAAALPMVEGEKGTTLWLVLRSGTDADAVFLVDLFNGEESRTAHLTGEAAKLIFATVPDLLATEPELHPSSVIAAKPSIIA